MTEISAQTIDSKAAPTSVSVTLLTNHTHAGQLCGKGSSIEVTRPEAEFLAARDIISKADLDRVRKALPAAAAK